MSNFLFLIDYFGFLHSQATLWLCEQVFSGSIVDP